jgi:hypothetical protein
MVSDHQCEDLFRAFATTLSNLGMGWIVDQVYEHIAAGKAVEPVSVKVRHDAVQINLMEEDEPSASRRSKSSRRIEFTPRERLTVLVNAAERCVKDCIELDDTLTKEFGVVHFRPEIPEEGERTFDVTVPDPKRRAAAEALNHQVREFISELER